MGAQAWRQRLPRAPSAACLRRRLTTTRSASKCEGTPAVESHSILVLVCVGAGCCGRCVCGSCCVCCHPAASCVAAAVAERVTYGCVDIWMCKSIALKLKLSARCVPPRGAAQHQPRGCAAHRSSSVRTTRLITRLLLRFELPGGYFGTTRLIIRLVVQVIIRLVVYYQLKADNPADNPAVSFVVIGCAHYLGLV